jgi:hypothetical protein
MVGPEGSEASESSDSVELSTRGVGTGAASAAGGLLVNVSPRITSGATTSTRAAGAPLATRTCTTWVRRPKAVITKPIAHTRTKATIGRRCSAANINPP